jgi:hypothetical protein
MVAAMVLIVIPAWLLRESGEADRMQRKDRVGMLGVTRLERHSEGAMPHGTFGFSEFASRPSTSAITPTACAVHGKPCA